MVVRPTSCFRHAGPALRTASLEKPLREDSVGPRCASTKVGSRYVAPSAVPAFIGNPAGFDLFPKPPPNDGFACRCLIGAISHGFRLLIAAIIWNLGTGRLGLPVLADVDRAVIGVGIASADMWTRGHIGRVQRPQRSPSLVVFASGGGLRRACGEIRKIWLGFTFTTIFANPGPRTWRDFLCYLRKRSDYFRSKFHS
jgi:hypothetical protein